MPNVPPGQGEHTTAAGDAIAAEILAELEPLRFREAADEADRDTCLRLRYRAVLEMRMAEAERFPDGLETDAFDAGAIHMLGTDRGRPVATSRIVLPDAERLLPTEAAFDLRLPNGASVVEWGRLVVDPEYRGDGHSVFMGLAARAWLSMRARGYATAIGATPKRLVALLEALGFTVTVLGPPRRYWGEERYPILCESGSTIHRLEREWLGAADAAPSHEPRTEPRGDQ